MMRNYTLGFVKCKDEILLLNRENPGWMGRWNGVGGRIEEGETPFEGFKRELLEEANIETENIKLCGYVSWNNSKSVNGAYIFMCEIEHKPYKTPIATTEGILDWKKLSWIIHPENHGVARNVCPYLERLIVARKLYMFETIWDGFNMVDVIITELKDLVEYYSEPFKISSINHHQQAIEILKKDYYRNINALYFIENNEYKEIHTLGNNVICRLNNNGVFVYWDGKSNFIHIEELLSEEDYKFYMIDDKVRVQLEKIRKIKWITRCEQFYLSTTEELDLPLRDVTSIDLDSVEYILDKMHYKLGYTKELLRKRIEEGSTSAIYENGKLVAWAYTHDDNSLGGLNVLAQYRKKGYASDVSCDLVRKEIEKNGVAYLQVEIGNFKSKNLIKKLGFQKSHNITWVGFKKE